MNRRHQGRLTAAFSVLASIYAALTACSLPPDSGAFPITVHSTYITLRWDPPAVRFTTPSLQVSKYRIYFRTHGIGSWQFIKEVPATGSPYLKLDHADFGNNSFDFAVSAVNESNIESTVHTSLDPTAYPYGGWFINWIIN